MTSEESKFLKYDVRWDNSLNEKLWESALKAATVRLRRETYKHIKHQTPGTNGHSEMVSREEQTQEMGLKGQDTSEEGEEDPTAPDDYNKG